jgi:hypothetical protein
MLEEAALTRWLCLLWRPKWARLVCIDKGGFKVTGECFLRYPDRAPAGSDAVRNEPTVTHETIHGSQRDIQASGYLFYGQHGFFPSIINKDSLSFGRRLRIIFRGTLESLLHQLKQVVLTHNSRENSILETDLDSIFLFSAEEARFVG